MSETRYPLAVAEEVAEELVRWFEPVVFRLEVVGSVRRRKPDVGDVEILYIPKFAQRKTDLFRMEYVDATIDVLDQMFDAKIIEKRLNVKGSEVFGEKNKLIRHVESGIPVDLFTANHGNWWNLLVCRTGPKESNMAICMAAQNRGLKWNPYGAGFTEGGREWVMTSEAQIFETVGLPYKEPKDR